MSSELEKYLLEVVMAYAATALIVGGIVAVSVIQSIRAARTGAIGPNEKTP